MVMGALNTATSTVMVRITANSAGFRREMTNMGRSLQMAGGQVSKFGTSLSASMTSIASMPAVMSTAFGARFIKDSMMVFMDFNDTLMRTAGILGEELNGNAELASGSFRRLEAEIRRVGRTTRFTATQAGQAAQALAIAGIAADEMVDDNVIEGMVNFAIAGGVDIQTAVNIGIAAVKAFQLELSDLGRVSDVLTMTFTKTNTTIVGVGESMKFAAPVMRAAGVEIEETASAIGALGNAGIRGTIAGTGLRMAINKLLKPTFDARQAIESLGMDIFVLTAAGQAAKAMLSKVDAELLSTRAAASTLKMEVTALNDALNDFNIRQAKNSLAISQIRLRARKEQRELTIEEISDIEKLELANDGLNVQAEKRRIELMATDRAYQKARRAEIDLGREMGKLEKQVELQTSGITSLEDMLHSLSDAGATTAQVLEIFGVRGGTAMSALLSQVDTFDKLKTLTLESEGRTKSLTDTLKTSAYNAVLIFKSAVTDLMITLGQPFMEAVVTELKFWTEASESGVEGATRLSDAFDNAGLPIEEMAAGLGKVVNEGIKGLIEAAPAIFAILEGLVAAAPTIARVFFGLVNVFGGVAQAIGGLTMMIGNFLGIFIDIIHGIILLISGDFGAAMGKFGDAWERVGKILSGFKKIVDGLARAIAPIIGLVTRFLGVQHAVGEDRKRQLDAGLAYGTVAVGTGLATGGLAPAMGSGGIIAQAATGTMAGFGVGTGAVVATQLAEGGIVRRPTRALVGEAGPEAVVPLKSYNQMMQLAMLRGDMATFTKLQNKMGGREQVSVSIGDINIGSGTSVSSGEVRAAINREIPKAIKDALRNNPRGAI